MTDTTTALLRSLVTALRGADLFTDAPECSESVTTVEALLDEANAALDALPVYLPSRKALLDGLRNHLNERATAQGWRKSDGHLTKAGERAALEFIVGAAAAVDALGLHESHGLAGVAFLAAVGGPGEFMKG